MGHLDRAGTRGHSTWGLLGPAKSTHGRLSPGMMGPRQALRHSFTPSKLSKDASRHWSPPQHVTPSPIRTRNQKRFRLSGLYTRIQHSTGKKTVVGQKPGWVMVEWLVRQPFIRRAKRAWHR